MNLEFLASICIVRYSNKLLIDCLLSTEYVLATSWRQLSCGILLTVCNTTFHASHMLFVITIRYQISQNTDVVLFDTHDFISRLLILLP